jgi:tetratricopeptide (TPR) repeat protein
MLRNGQVDLPGGTFMTRLAERPTTGNGPAILMRDWGQMGTEVEQRMKSDPDNAELSFVLGMIALREGKLETACEALGKSVARDPGNADFQYGLGVAFRTQGREDEALFPLREAIRLRPDYPEALHDVAVIQARRGRLDEAASLYRRALAARPDFADPAAGLASVLAAQGKAAEAAEAFEQACRLRSEDSNLHKGRGLAEARRGRPEDAAAAYREAIRLQPNDPDAHNELGIVHARCGRPAEAEISYREAIRLKPDFADAHNNLGNAVRLLGRLDEAIGCYQEALRLRPEYPEGHNNLGIALKHKGKFDEAISSYERALRLRPSYAEAHNNLGIALGERGKADAAILSYQQALRLRPDYVEAMSNLANALADQNRLPDAVTVYKEALKIRPSDAKLHKNLGITLSKMDKLADAEASYRESLKHRPDYPDAFNDLGITLSRQLRFDDAIASYKEAIRLRPNYAEAYNNMGNALRNSGAFDEAIASYQRAVQLRPGYADAHNNLGIAYAEMGRFDEAVASYTACLKLRPTHVDAHMNRALTWLRKGDYAQGWAEYEWRWKKRSFGTRPLIQPLWNGFDISGRRILLVTEQGFGDTIQFIRYAKPLKDQGAQVILECPERLLKLMALCPWIDQIVPQGQPLPDYDVYAPMLTLPGLMGTKVPKAVAEFPYLRPTPELVLRWRKELGDGREFKVGINWQGNPGYAGDRHRSIPLTMFEPLSKVPGVRLISLQKNHGLDQLQALNGRFPVEEWGSRLDEQTGPFLDTAALMTCLDLFVTSDTAVAHLAGALGVPTWMPLSTTPDWRWMTGREDCPWYPSMRIYRQEKFMDWDPVFQRIVSDLRRIVPASARPRSAAVPASFGELLDKISILEIKAERISDGDKLLHVRHELTVLLDARERTIVPSNDLDQLAAALKNVNETLWDVEDEIRICEREGDFGPRFIGLARSVYGENDRRAALKRQINDLLGSELVEEKSYASVSPANESKLVECMA